MRKKSSFGFYAFYLEVVWISKELQCFPLIREELCIAPPLGEEKN